MVPRVLAAMLIVTPTLVLVGLTAAVIHDVRLASWEWAAGFGLLWVASVPFVALGIAIGKSFSSTTAYALSTVGTASSAGPTAAELTGPTRRRRC